MTDMHTDKGSATMTTYGMATWVAIAMSAFATFWSVANPRDDIKNVESRLQAEINERQTVGTATTFTTLTTKEIDVIMKKLDTDLVPRPENTAHWDANQRVLEALQKQINDIRVSNKEFATSYSLEALRQAVQELRTQYANTFTAGDQFKNINDQLKEIRLQLHPDNQRPIQGGK